MAGPKDRDKGQLRMTVLRPDFVHIYFDYQSIIENQSLQNRSLRLIDGPAGTYHPRQMRIYCIRAKCIHTAHGSRLVISPIARSAQPAGARPRDTSIERLELTGRKWTKKADTNFTGAISNRNQRGAENSIYRLKKPCQPARIMSTHNILTITRSTSLLQNS